MVCQINPSFIVKNPREITDICYNILELQKWHFFKLLEYEFVIRKMNETI
jgi:hypothetical protein